MHYMKYISLITSSKSEIMLSSRYTFRNVLLTSYHFWSRDYELVAFKFWFESAFVCNFF